MVIFILDLSRKSPTTFTLHGVQGELVDVELPVNFYSHQGLQLHEEASQDSSTISLVSLAHGETKTFVPFSRATAANSYQFFESIYEKLAIVKGIVPFASFEPSTSSFSPPKKGQ